MGDLEGKGSILNLASRDVITVPPTLDIKSAVGIMVKNRFRRLPVADSGSIRLLGIIGSSDIVDLLGGGSKFQLISKAHKGNFLSAINDSVRQIMNTDVLTIEESGTGNEGLDLLLNSDRGGIVVVDRNDVIKGVVTEKDYLEKALEESSGKTVAKHMTRKVITATPGTTLGDASKIMVRNSFRRLPIISEDIMVGLMTTRSMIEFIGRNGAFHRVEINDIKEILDTRVSEFMSHDTAAVQSDSDLKTAIQLMITTGEGTVSVLEGEKLVGLITERDVLQSLKDKKQ